MLSSQRSIRWWPVIAVLLLAAIGFAGIWLTGERIRQERVHASVLLIGATTLLLLIWLIAFSRIPWKVRSLAVVAVLGLGISIPALVRVRGMTGDLVPILEWRWKPKADAALADDSRRSSVRIKSPTALATEFSYPQFLGPNRNATVKGVRLDPDWSSRPPRLLWNRRVGAGWSAFAVVGGLAVTQEQRGGDEMVTAYELISGKPRWGHADRVRYESVVAGDGPRATPTISGDRVFAVGSTGILNGLDLRTGKRLWQRNIAQDNDAAEPGWGRSGSPLVLDNLVIVSAGGSDGKSLVAYHRETGAIVWRAGSDAVGYSSPTLVTLAGVAQVVIFNAASVASHEPETGRVLWQQPWPAAQPNVAQPVPLPGDRLLVSAGYGVGSKMIKVTKSEQGSFQTELIWETPRLKAKFANMVLHDNFIYGLDDGVLVCLDPTNGERRWKAGRYGHGQLILVDDLLLVQTEHGEVVLVEARPDRHHERARFTAMTGKTWNSPTLVGPYLLIRNDQEASCYELPIRQLTNDD